MSLADLAAREVDPAPGPLLATLALAVDPAWTRGARCAVALEVAGRDGGWWIVGGGDGTPLAVAPSAAGAPADATLTLDRSALLPVLARLAPPPGERVLVTGDAAAAHTLLHLFARVQGLR